MSNVERLSLLKKEIEALQAKQQRLLGQLESAQERLAKIDSKCALLKVRPEDLQDAISTLEDKRAAKLSLLESQVSEAAEMLSRYSGE